MDMYKLMHKNRELALITLDSSNEVFAAIINSETQNFLPLPLKRLIHHQQEFILEKDRKTSFYVLNEDGCTLVEQWLTNREVPLERVKKQKINKRMYMLSSYARSFIDCYWLCPLDTDLLWDDIKLFNLNEVTTLDVILNNNARFYDKVNSTLGGQLDKSWYVSNKDGVQTLKLCKKHNPSESILSVREILACKIYELQGYDNYCKYSYVYNTASEVVGCRCSVFTSENLELITAYDLLEEYNWTQQNRCREKIIECAVAYGADELKIKRQLDIQTIVDFLVTNRDRHQGNIGFLRDSETLQIVCVAPIYDSGSSVWLEEQLPESVLNTSVNSLCTTEVECLKTVSNLQIINLDKLPSVECFRNEIIKNANVRAVRVDKLTSLYEEKIKYLQDLQSNCREIYIFF